MMAEPAMDKEGQEETAQGQADADLGSQELDTEASVAFTVTHGKETHPVTFGLQRSVAELKTRLQGLTGVHVNMQKLLFKGMLKDNQTLEAAGVKDGVKVILMGSKVEDIVKLAAAAANAPKLEDAKVVQTPWSELTEHKKILDKGKPEDATLGLKGRKLPLPSDGLRGLLNSRGMKTRLTFKLESDQLWIGTNEVTQKLPIGSIRNVKSQPVTGQEEYSIVALQLGPTDKSNYYLYWVPSQYVESLKDQILGPFAAWF
ncbi:ubiquitin-related domain-containing protein [Gaertneriomyces semiglobifer]|nr:ubiquitin-related domain-containing protein [Gaertneriomyces semiglobifer]